MSFEPTIKIFREEAGATSYIINADEYDRYRAEMERLREALRQARTALVSGGGWEDRKQIVDLIISTLAGTEAK